MRVCTLTVLLCLFVSGVAGAAVGDKDHNWHHWRGPHANGIVPHGDPPITWGEGQGRDQNVKWKVPIPGNGNATPIVWGDRIFVLTAIDTGRKPAAPPDADTGPARKIHTRAPKTIHQFVVLCLNRGTGAVKWRRIASETVPHEGHHAHHGYASGSPTTDGRTFEVLATNKLDAAIDASPVVVGKHLFLRGKKCLYCIAAE